MKTARRVKRPGAKKVVGPALGIDVDITGESLAAQALQRIEWHKQMAAEKAAALERIPAQSLNHLGLSTDWRRDERRRELAESVRGHEEHARFLEFVRSHLKPRQIYRLSLQDLTYLEITPQGRYV